MADPINGVGGVKPGTVWATDYEKTNQNNAQTPGMVNPEFGPFSSFADALKARFSTETGNNTSAM